MKSIMNSLKLIKYAYNLKMSVISSILFLAVGILFLVTNDSEIAYLGIIYILLGPLMLIQLLYSLIYSNLIAASGKRKKMELTVPNIMTVLSTIVVYVFQIILAVVATGMDPLKKINYISILLGTASVIFIVVVYYGVCYKHFIGSTIVFAVSFAIVHCLSMSDYIKEWLGRVFAGNVAFAGAVGMSIVVVGLIISCLLRAALYRKDLAERAMGAALRKAMQ